ncbi:MAG: hypothetical protein PIR02_15970 [Microbacterium enclense]
MATKKRYIVTAARIVARIPGAQGGEAYLRKGRLLPASIEDAEIARLLELELIEPAPDEIIPAPAVGGEGEQILTRADVDLLVQREREADAAELDVARRAVEAEAQKVVAAREEVEAERRQLDAEREELTAAQSALEAAQAEAAKKPTPAKATAAKPAQS